jgi:trehalose-6-phosphate synthase
MANALYPLWKQEILKGTANNLLNSATGATGVYCSLVDTGTYTYSSAHQFYSSLSGVVGTDQEILTKTQTTGTFDGDDLTYTAVSGNSVEALVLYRKNAGANTTWPLVAYHRHRRDRPARDAQWWLDYRYMECIWHLHALRSYRRRHA